MGLAEITWPNRKTPLANFACRYPGLGAQTLPGQGPANPRELLRPEANRSSPYWCLVMAAILTRAVPYQPWVVCL